MPALGEVLLGIVNNLICANGANQVHFPRAAHAGDFRPKIFGKLHSGGANAARRAVYQHLMPRLDVSLVPQALQGGDCGSRYSGCFVKADV